LKLLADDVKTKLDLVKPENNSSITFVLQLFLLLGTADNPKLGLLDVPYLVWKVYFSMQGVSWITCCNNASASSSDPQVVEINSPSGGIHEE